MEKMQFSSCYGCGVCALICSKEIIELKLNESGFYKPTILNPDECINCRLCLSICSYNDTKVDIQKAHILKFYAGWCNDGNIRSMCSSGGISYAIALSLMQIDYKSIGVRYNISNNRAEHFLAGSSDEYLSSIGSKYIPSYTLNGFRKINKKNKFFISGTPCQIDSLRRYIQKMNIEDNFVLMDFFCHGVPSMNLWQKYIEIPKKKIGSISHISWRNKSNGWHNSFEIIAKCDVSISDCVDNECFNYHSSFKKGDLFYNFFLGNKCLAEACYEKCKYKLINSSADIRVGDLWSEKYRSDEAGVSGIVVLTRRGQEVINNLTNCTIIDESSSVVLAGQMQKNAVKSKSYFFVKYALKGNMPLTKIYNISKLIDFILNIPRKVLLRSKKALGYVEKR